MTSTNQEYVANQHWRFSKRQAVTVEAEYDVLQLSWRLAVSSTRYDIIWELNQKLKRGGLEVIIIIFFWIKVKRGYLFNMGG